MLQFPVILFFCLLPTLSVNSKNVSTNATDSDLNSTSFHPSTLTKIPLSDILRDLNSGLSEPESGDLGGLESNPKRTIVGVKKHKNYEIVLYEYSEEQGLGGSSEDFDNPFQTDDEAFKKSGTGQRKSSKAEKGRNKPKKPKAKLPLVSEIEIKPKGEKGTVNKHPSKSRKTGGKRPKSHSDDIDELEGGEIDDSSSYDEEYDEDFPSRSPGSPFPWGSRLPPRGTSRRAPKPFDDDEDEDASYPSDEEYDSHNSRRSKHKPSKRPSKSGQHSRDRFEIAPGAGRFSPTRRPSYFDIRNQTEEEYEYEEDDDPEIGPFCRDPTGKKGICEEYFKCSVLYSNVDGRINLKDYRCKLGNQIGICCPIIEDKPARGHRSRAVMKMVNGRKPLSRQIKKLIRSNVNNSIDFGADSLLQLEEIEQELILRGGQVTRDSPAFTHSRFFPSSKKIRQVSEVGFELLQTTNDLSDRLRLTNEVGGLGLKSFKSSNIRAINDRCPRLPPCGINKYRLIDGSCNNLRRQKMGQSLTPLSRVLEPAYADGRWEPRISVRGFLLPSARLLSSTFIQDRDNPNTKYTLLTMQIGQFIDHDISSVPIFTFANSSGISCCRNGQFLPPQDRHPNCMPIEIPADDPFYSRFGQRCMNFVRSRMAPRIDCSLGYADQMNAVTHWLDLSNVYGSSETEMRDLRLFQGGLLQFSELADRKMLLPLKATGTRDIDYKAGDDRVNEMQGLMVMHLIWLREHNRVAFELSRINPFWNDEQLFQEARRICIAEYQHIIYNEWLPIIVGREYMESYGILPQTRKRFFKGYDPDIDASIENAFSVAGFRMGHSLVQGIVRLIDDFGRSNEQVIISNHALNAERTRAPNQIDKWIRALAQQPIQKFDPFVTQQLNGRLFQARGGMFGMDLSSLNIQRSRDHGVPGYNALRELCQTGKRAKSFDDFRDWIAPEIVANMRRIYDHPDDVDLWIGGISETPLTGALIGPTFTCIVGDQFARTKKGDRYFYDVGDQTHSFSPEQLQEIRKASFARILCDNGDALEAVQPSAFLQPDFDFNSLVDCRRSRRIPRINLRLWENEPTP